MNCFFCHKPADLDDDQTYREVLSWVNGPKLDGPKLREQTGRIAHEDCINKILKGLSPDEQPIFDEDWPKEGGKGGIEYQAGPPF